MVPIWLVLSLVISLLGQWRVVQCQNFPRPKTCTRMCICCDPWSADFTRWDFEVWHRSSDLQTVKLHRKMTKILGTSEISDFHQFIQFRVLTTGPGSSKEDRHPKPAEQRDGYTSKVEVDTVPKLQDWNLHDAAWRWVRPISYLVVDSFFRTISPRFIISHVSYCEPLKLAQLTGQLQGFKAGCGIEQFAIPFWCWLGDISMAFPLYIYIMYTYIYCIYILCIYIYYVYIYYVYIYHVYIYISYIYIIMTLSWYSRWKWLALYSQRILLDMNPKMFRSGESWSPTMPSRSSSSWSTELSSGHFWDPRCCIAEMGGVLSHGGIIKSSMWFSDFPEINHPFWANPILGNPKISHEHYCNRCCLGKSI